MPEKKTVTIYIPTRNRLNLLKRAVLSALNQTYNYVEIIVVNDASSDNTEEYLIETAEKFRNFRFHSFKISQGACAARNWAIENATGYYALGLDDDDELSKYAVEYFIDNYNKKYALIYSDCITVGKFKYVVRRPGFVDQKTILDSNCVGNQVFAPVQNYKNAGLFDVNLPANQDYDMWIRMLNNKAIGKRIAYPLQKIYANHTKGRITVSNKKVRGSWLFYKKYKHLMTNYHRKKFLTKFLRIKNRRKLNSLYSLLFSGKKIVGFILFLIVERKFYK